jgi:methyl-accepting chemotaxis protein
MSDLASFRLTIARVLVALSLVHAPLFWGIASALGRNSWMIGGSALVCAIVPALLLRLDRPIATVGMALACALVGQTSLLVFAFEGHPWQVEMHFYYFAVLAMLSGFCDWRVLLTAAVLVAVHHLTLDFALPSAVYPGPSDFTRVAVHAVIVVIETAMLAYIGQAITSAFAAATAATAQSKHLAGELSEVVRQRESDLATSFERANTLSIAVDRFQAQFGHSMTILQTAATELGGNANDLRRVAVRAQERTTQVSHGSEQTREHVSSLAGAGGELAETITAIGERAAESSGLASEAASQANATNKTLVDLDHLSDEVGQVVGLITGIARQTNLLALNATIEAARAGEAGRGFSIVAQEVKALATQTTKASLDIAEKIAAMQDTAAASISALQRIAATISKVNALSREIAHAVEQQAASARDIAGSVDTAAAGATQVRSALLGIEILAQETSGAAELLNQAANNIATQAEIMAHRIAGFATEVRAA